MKLKKGMLLFLEPKKNKISLCKIKDILNNKVSILLIDEFIKYRHVIDKEDFNNKNKIYYFYKPLYYTKRLGEKIIKGIFNSQFVEKNK
jgi:hypothetical protein